MWLKKLLTSRKTVPKFFGWTQYAVLREFSDKNPKDLSDSVKSTSEESVSKLLDDAASFKEAKDKSWSTTPYPQTTILPSEIPARPYQDPEETSIFLFPGQGTIKVGQIKDYLHFPRVQDLFSIADEVLKIRLQDLCLKGPEWKLNITEYNQVATIIMCMAALEKVWEERPHVIDSCKAVAGYSVGELAALMFSGALGLEDGIKLAAIRGAAMQSAADSVPQGMISAYCLSGSNIGEIKAAACEWALSVGVPDPVCVTAIYLCPFGRVFAGHNECLTYIQKNAAKLRLKNIKRLPVSGAFHSSLMEPAIKSFKKAVLNITFDDIRVPVYSNFTGKPYDSKENIPKLLIKQIISPVRWEQILHDIYSRSIGTNFPRTFDFASNGYLTSILSRLNLKASRNAVKI